MMMAIFALITDDAADAFFCHAAADYFSFTLLMIDFHAAFAAAAEIFFFASFAIAIADIDCRRFDFALIFRH